MKVGSKDRFTNFSFTEANSAKTRKRIKAIRAKLKKANN